MNEKFNKYLDNVAILLSSIPSSEKEDILKEIRSSILEMQNDNIADEEILNRLGSPNDLANHYLKENYEITIETEEKTNTSFALKKLSIAIIVYTIIFFLGIIVVPSLIICTPVFILSGIVSILIIISKIANIYLHLNIPYMENIGVKVFNFELHPFIELILATIVGFVLILLGIFFIKYLNYLFKKYSFENINKMINDISNKI